MQGLREAMEEDTAVVVAAATGPIGAVIVRGTALLLLDTEPAGVTARKEQGKVKLRRFSE